jgi:hypothetical protein
MTAVLKHDPAEIRRWAAEHGINVADAPEPAPADTEPEPGPEPEPARPDEPVSDEPARPRFAEYERPDWARAGLIQSRIAQASAERQAQLAQIAEERELATMARRHARLRRELPELETAVAENRDRAGALASQVARLSREADQLEERARAARFSAARQAAEHASAAALARRVVQVLEGDREMDPFTSALAALAQNKRRLSGRAGDDDARMAALAEAVSEAAGRRARVTGLQNRQITVNKSHGPDSPEADAVRRELAAERLAMVVLATLGTGLSSDDVVSVVLTGALPEIPGRVPRLLTGPDWPVQP